MRNRNKKDTKANHEDQDFTTSFSVDQTPEEVSKHQ